MLKVPYKRLRPNSKGGLNDKHSKCGYQHKSKLHIANVGNKVLQGIPVLSIFALVGIVTYGLTISGASLFNGANKVSAAETITASSSDGNSTISFTIAGADKTEQVSAGRGSTIYRAHTITLNASNIESYALTISGNPNMINPSGSTTSNTITSTNGTVNGTNLASNTWGYYYGEYNTTNGNNKESVVYKPLVSTGTTIDTGKPTNYTITNQTKNLVFAAKFGEDIAQGRYYANVDLSVTATPKLITTYSVTYNGNGNTGGAAPSKQEVKTDATSHAFTAAAQGNLVKTGYTFLGWSENQNATSATYTANSTISLTADNPSKTLYAVWAKIYTYQVTYDCNDGTGCPSNLNTTSTNTSYSYSVPSTIPTRSGYKFLGYSTNNTATSADSNYAPGARISLTSSSPSRTLYAVWKALATAFPSNLTTMRGMTAEICGDVAIGTSKTLTDSRDNNSYVIRRLSDGNCWMAQNLRIVGRTITSSNSDVSSNYSIPASSTTGFSEYGESYAYYGGDINYGAYYSWYTATAGAGAYGTTGSVSSSICPKGWKLPSSGYSGDYPTLQRAWTSVTWTSYNGKNGRWLGGASESAGGAFFPAAGYYSNSAAQRIGERGYYWSRNGSTSTAAYNVGFHSSSFTVTNAGTKYDGVSVRCVAYSS